jgi:hypothetical protein
MDMPGRLKGEDARLQATRELRRIREAFEAVVARSEESRTDKEEVEARVADLEAELMSIAASTARQAKVAPALKKPRSGRNVRTLKKTPSRKRKRTL